MEDAWGLTVQYFEVSGHWLGFHVWYNIWQISADHIWLVSAGLIDIKSKFKFSKSMKVFSGLNLIIGIKFNSGDEIILSVASTKIYACINQIIKQIFILINQP